MPTNSINSLSLLGARDTALSLTPPPPHHLQVVSLETSPLDPSTFVVATVDGRCTVWRVVPGSDAPGAVDLHLVAALMTNNVVDGLPAPWSPVAPLGTCHPVLWCTSDLQPWALLMTTCRAISPRGGLA